MADIDSRRLVKLHKEHISDISSTDYPGVYPGEDHHWDIETFNRNLRIDFQYVAEDRIEFDLIGADASIANAFRRILISEVPTIAIERVYVYNNTSVIQDEVLSHRLGLVPLHINPRILEDAPSDYQNNSTDRNTIVFRLDVDCTDREGVTPSETDPEKLYVNSSVYADSLVWEPQGEQETMFAADPPRAVNPKILLAKLRPGQGIHVEMHAVKSIGRDHSKFSPVATATYRLMPHIQLLRPGDRYEELNRRVEKLELPDQETAERFRKAFQEGVIEVKKEKGKYFVRVKNPRLDTVTRRILELPEFEGMVKLGRVRDWFIFSVESAGQYPAVELFPEAVSVLRGKVQVLKADAERLRREWEGRRDTEIERDTEMTS